jgi:hypothetical protein
MLLVSKLSIKVNKLYYLNAYFGLFSQFQTYKERCLKIKQHFKNASNTIEVYS